MSVGYNLEGILRPNVQWYLDAMADASAHLPAYVEIVARRFPAVRDVEIPARLSDTVTLSTMHGCPPDEIERISLYLLEERGLHTSVKCNPTLLGAERVRGIVNDDLGFADVSIPDEAFGHDLRYADAVPMFRRLRQAADARGLDFGLKLSNTLEVENRRGVFEHDPTMYMSGRAAPRGHASTWPPRSPRSSAATIPLSFAGGADAFNVADLLAAGMRTVTVCSDLLKSGGYLRMLQYAENIDAAFDAVGALDTADFIGAGRRQASTAAGIRGRESGSGRSRRGSRSPTARGSTCARYADVVRHDWRYRKDSFRTDRSKTRRALGLFDCIAAPCVDECPVDQQVPRYMAAVREGDVAGGRRDHPPRQPAARDPRPGLRPPVREHLHPHPPRPAARDPPGQALHHGARGGGLASRRCRPRAAGRGSPSSAPDRPGWPPPSGWPGPASASRSSRSTPTPGGMVGGAIPAYRLPQAQIDRTSRSSIASAWRSATAGGPA